MFLFILKKVEDTSTAEGASVTTNNAVTDEEGTASTAPNFATKADDVENTNQCTFCDFEADQKDHLENHIETMHKGLKTFQCPQCSFTAGRKYHLERHVKKVHEGLKPYECEICEFSTDRNYRLTEHLKIKHDIIRPPPLRKKKKVCITNLCLLLIRNVL